MLYLRNPGGRIVIFDTQEHYDQYVGKAGFTIPSKSDVNIFLAQRTAAIEDINMAASLAKNPKEGIHFATVSPGGGRWVWCCQYDPHPSASQARI